jgi:hypothetical protein
MKKIIVTLIIALFALPLNLQAAETQVTFAWEANNPAPFGYQIFCREAGQSYDYSTPAWEGDNTFSQCIIDQLDDSKTYYFVIRAVDENDNQSSDSNEIRFPNTGDDDRSLNGNSGSSGSSDISGSSCFIQSIFTP